MKNYLRLKSILPFLFGSILALLISVPAMGQTFVETFGNLPGPNGSYQTETWAGDNGFGTWTATDARTDRTINGSAITVRNGELTSPTINGGISYLALTTERQFSGGSGDLDVLINGDLVGTIAYSGSVEMDTIFNIDVSGDFTIVIETPGNGDRIAMDDLTWEEYTPPTMGFVETFTNLSPNGSYQTVTWPGDNGFGTWTATDARTDRTINGSAITVRNGELTSPTINGGISYLALTTERQFGGGSGDLDVLINGNLVGTIAYSGSVEMDTIFNIDVSGDFTIVIETPGNGDRIAMDDLTWEEYTPPTMDFVETFTNLSPNGSYQTVTWPGDNGFGTWTATDARTDRTINGSAITVRNGELTSPTINGGISYLALTTERQFSGGSGDLDVLINGNLVGTIAYSGSVEMDTIFNIDVSGDFTIVIETPGNGDRIAMDDLTWEEYTPPTMGFVETFTNLRPNGSYQTVTWPGDNGFGTWTATDARTDRTINGSAITVRNGELTSPTINGGISYLALTTERQFSGGSGDLDVLINGNLVGTIAYSGSVEMDTIFNIDVAGDFTIVIETPGNGDRIAMDDLTWAEFASGPPPVATEPIPYMDNFDTDPFTNGWTAFSVTGDEAWEYGANFQNVSMSAFSGGCNENEDWFISPAFDFDAQTNEELDVDVSRGFAGDNDLELLYSTDYDGVSDPNTATWTTITTITNDFFDNNSIPDNQAVNFGVFNDLESVSGIGYVAFRFDYSTGSCATWRVNGFNLAIGGLPLACPLLEFNCFGASQSFSGWEGEGVSNDPAQGQLCTEQLAFFGLSSGNVNFGGENTGGDYSRGITTPGVTTGGLYALPYNGGVDTALYFQPTGSDFTPGGFIVKACNETGSAQNRFSIGYDFLKYNDQDRSMVIEVEVSNDNIAYVSVPQLADTIDQPADVPASIEISQLLFDSIDITVDTNQCLFVRFTVDDFTGGGSRPEMGFDNITIEPVSSLAARDVAISDCVQDSATVSFEITGGIDPIRINGEDVSNLTFGDFSGGVFTSDPIADSSSFQFFVSDNNACSVDPVIVSGEILCDPCVDMEEPDAINPIAVCEGEEITLTPEGGGINNTVEGYRFYEDTTSAPIAEGQTYAFTPLDSTILFVSAFTTGPDCESGYVPVEIAVNNLPVIDGTVTNEGCPGAGDGSIMLNVMATTPSFEWTGPNNFSSQEQNIIDLEPGSYNVIVTDQNGCSNSASFSVEEGEDLEAPIFVACAADITLGCTDDITPSATGEPEV